MITNGWRRWVACVLSMAAVAAAAEPAEPLRFLRVHVPHGKLAEIELGEGRFVPMSAKEFEAAVVRLRGMDGSPAVAIAFGAMAEKARYEARLVTAPQTAAGGSRGANVALVGTASWTTPAPVSPGRAMPVGGLRVSRAWMRTAAGTGDALVFGRSDGTLAITMPEPGDYFFEWRCGRTDLAQAALAFRLPLVPALATTIELEVPEGWRPLVDGAVAEPIDRATDDGAQTTLVTWQIEVGPRPAVDVVLHPDDGGASPRARAWTDVAVRGREVRVTTLIAPVDAWRPIVGAPTIVLDVPRGLIVTDVHMSDEATTSAVDWGLATDGQGLEITVPTRCLGSRAAIAVEALAPMEWMSLAAVPLVQLSGRAWAGGGIVVRVDPALVISRIKTDGCLVVPPEVAVRWPMPRPAAADDDGPPGVRPTRVHLEHQRSNATVSLMIEPRVAQVVIDRTTVVDVSPDAVLGRVTCGIGVQRGEAFDVRGRLAEGWVLDTVELVDADGVDIAPPDWKVVRDTGEREVRVALAAAVSPSRPVTLRLTGHRAGVPPGVDVTSAELDMVQFDGETSAAILAVKTGPEMTVDLVGDEPVLDAASASRADDTAIRVRLPAGSRTPERVMRLVRRRPPVDARTQVRLTSRDGRLTESFTFECRPQRTDMDSLVIHFSTVMDDRLEWSLLPPAAGAIVARRIAAPDRREEQLGEGIADSWIVELSPPARDAVTIRAAATTPFTGPVPVPLAWVEGAMRQAGEVSVREAGRFRPRVLNRRLVELPPTTDGGEQALATVAEFAFDPARGRPDDPLPAAELVPGGDGGGDDARAWVWREANTVWCHASGIVEYETCFEIENHGRASVTLSLPVIMQMQGVLVDGTLVTNDGGSPLGGTMTVDLPVGSRFVTVVVRAAATRTPTLGAWEVDPQGPALDVPVLQRESRALLAPGVAIVRAWGAYRLVDGATLPASAWSQRLLGATLRPASATREGHEATAAGGLTRFGSVAEGYRSVTLVPVVGRRVGGGLLAVRTDAVIGAAIAAAAAAGALVLLLPSSQLWVVPCMGALAAVGSLWVAVPFDGVFRAACWAAVAAAVVRLGVFSRRAGGQAAIAAAVFLLSILPAAGGDDEADVLRVYLTPVEAAGVGGETALVPEPLFRALARGTAEPAAVRMVACEITARLPVTGDAVDAAPWNIAVDVDADAGTTLVIDQGDHGSRVVGGQARVDGIAVALRVEDDGRRGRIALPGAGRHRLEIEVRPSVVRRGDVEEFVIGVPSAAVGTLLLAGAADVGTVACEAAPPNGRFHAAVAANTAARGVAGFDIAGAAAVRLSRVVDPRLRMAAAVRSASSRNDVFWDLDACRLVATFDVASPNEVVRSFCVGITPGLVLANDIAGVRAIGPDRLLVERPEPVRGGFAVQLPLRMPLADPVGVFTVPGAWIEDVVADSRTTQLVPAPDLSVDVTLPEGLTAAPRESDSSLQGFAWRTEVVRGLGGSTVGMGGGLVGTLSGPGRAVVAVERRRTQPRATQQLAIEFGADHVQLGLEARIDATSTALVEIQVDVPEACVVDRVELVEDRALLAEAAERGPVDIRWSRVAPGALLVVAQRPRAGRYRLEVAARLKGRPSARGAVTVMRAVLPGSVPLVVSWRSLEGRGAAVRAAYDEPLDEAVPPPVPGRATSGSIDLPGGETALVYDLGDTEAADAATPAAAPSGVGPALAGDEHRDGRVELADVFMEMDGRGRAWGRVQFDVVAAGSSLRVALPAGMRLFEVLVDGRAVAGTPQEDGTWMVPLFDVRWPRTVLAVFAGDTGAPAVDGAPFAIAAPRLVGLPCRMMAWTVRVAPGMELRVAEPARVVDAQTMGDQRRAVAEHLEDEFIRAIEEANAEERPRMTDFARLRRAGAALPAEAAWARAMGTVDDATVRAIVDEPMDSEGVRGLVVRVGRAADPTTGTRAVATLVILAAAAGAWQIAARWPQAWRASAGRAVPGLAVVAGIVWLVTFAPTWPGWLLLAVAVGLQLAARRSRGAPGDDVGDSTITQFAPPATAASWAGSSTATFLVPRR